MFTPGYTSLFEMTYNLCKKTSEQKCLEKNSLI
jgi:hypothetical protein